MDEEPTAVEESEERLPARPWPDWPDWPDWLTHWDWPESPFARWSQALWNRFPEMLETRRQGVTGFPIRVEESEEDGAYVIRAELPGMDPEQDIEVTVDAGRLHISAERRETEQSKKEGRYRSEFRYGAYVRTIPLPPGVTEADVTASYRNGILEVRLPVGEEKAKATRIPVQRD